MTLPRKVESHRIAGAQNELNGLVITIELTLISIIQAIALGVLTEASRDVLIDLQFAFWPYVASSLLLILIFWSRSLIHTLTVIRWPLEFGHNFLYFGCTLIEAVLFTQVANARTWYVLSLAYAGLIWLLFLWDLPMIRRRIAVAADEERALLLAVEKDQLLNIRFFLPGTIAFYLVSALAVWQWPDFFLVRGGHLLLCLLQLAGALACQYYVVGHFRSLTPLIARACREWRQAAEPADIPL